MDSTAAIRRAATNIQKSQLKKRKVPEGGQSKDRATKKKSRGRQLAFEPKHLEKLTQNLGCTRFFCPLTGNTALFSALTQEAMFFMTYPVMLEAPEAKGKRRSSSKTICGVSKPELVFTVLRQCFSEIFPDADPQRIADWDVYRWNVAYYGQGIMQRAPSWNELKEKIQQLRTLGGDKLPPHVNIFTEVQTAKASKAMDVCELFSNDTNAVCLSREQLKQLREKAYELAASQNLLAIDEKELEDRIAGQEEDSESEESEQDESDEE